jgi:hypothetical protein
MAKASSKMIVNPTHREVVQNALVDLVRRSIRSGVAYASLGTELMAQGYAILTGKDVAAARVDVVAMMGGGSAKGKASGGARKRKGAAKRGVKKRVAKAGGAKKRTASKRGRKRKARA